MKVKEIIRALEEFAPLPLQESYDNAGLQVGLTDAEVSGALLCLDVTEEVVDEAISKGLNLIIAHHPLLFHGLKTISNGSYIERCVTKAIKNDVCIYSAHTNLDNALNGVNYKMAEKLQLRNVRFLQQMPGNDTAGSGVVGELQTPMSSHDFIKLLKETFHVGCVKYSAYQGEVKTVALCGGAGAFLAGEALRQGADAFVTGEIKYHEYFGTGDEILLAEIGHYESEQYTVELFKSLIQERFPQIVVAETTVKTNPIYYM